ncbi:MAG TPA: glycosyltransferase family 2 protein [Actinomycetota bacterium]|nr:glycosyltransferase family 2 protein [Actinomycetota bacterium]
MTGRSPGEAVTAVVPTLGREPLMLGRCLASIPPDVEVIVAIDAPEGTQVPGAGDRCVWTGGGAGFSGTAMRGIGRANRELVLLLNDDAWLAPGAVEVMADAMHLDPLVAGIAPKIKFASWPDLINSVGSVLFADGRADSRGIGQPDIGQYDRPRRVFGCHFAAALLRRDLFEDHVGPLDVTFGSYYEDVDWCLRANLAGYRFQTAPDALVFHEHSATAGRQPDDYAFVNAERNLLWTVVKGFESSRAAGVVTRRLVAHARNVLLQGPHGRGSRRVLRQFWSGAPAALAARRLIQRARKVCDNEVLALSAGEKIWFDSRSGPVLDGRCLLDALSRHPDHAATAAEFERLLAVGADGDVDSLLRESAPAAGQYWNRLQSRAAP